MLNLMSLNQRVNALASKINAIAGSADLDAVLTLGSNAGSNNIDMNNNDILNVNNIDVTTINGSAYPPVVSSDTLQDVLNAGNLTDLSATFQDDLTTPLSNLTISDSAILHSSISDLAISSNQRITLSADNVDLSATGRLIVPSLASTNFLDYNPSVSTLELQQTTTGGIGNPILRLDQQDTASGSANITFFKNTFTNGQTIGDMSFRAKTAITGNPEREYARIGGTIRNNASGNVDGSISLQARVNDAITELMRINGGDGTGQIEIFQPLDLNNNDIITSTGDIELNATGSSGVGNIILRPLLGGFVQVYQPIDLINNAITTSTTDIDLNATGSAGTGDILLNPKSTAFVKVSEDIQTDSKITTLTDPTGCSVDFAGGTVDYRFTLDPTKIELHYTDSANYLSTQQIFQDNSTDEAYFKQSYTDIATSNIIETIIENDTTHHRIKLSETASGANCEITKDEIDVDDGSGQIAKLTATDLTFNGVSIRPYRSNTNGLAFSVSGSPTAPLWTTATIADMIAGTTWKVDVAFYSNALNTANVITYTITDTTPQFVEQNSVFGYSQGGFQNAIQFLSSGTPMSNYCSFTDTFEVSGLASGSCNFNLTAGTSDSSTWGGGAAVCSISIVLTRIA